MATFGGLFTPDEHFSPSSLTLATNCMRAWGYRYLLGMRDLELDWFDIEAGRVQATSRQRVTALGKAVHGVLERYFRREPVDWSTTPAHIALPGLAYLPHPTDLRGVWIEHPIAIDTRQWAPTIEPLRFEGYKDLVADDGKHLWLIDYKTTRDFKWQRTPLELGRDLQAVTYEVDVEQRWGRRPRTRWVYFRTRGNPQARPTDFDLTGEAVGDVMMAAILQADDLRQKMRAFRNNHLRVVDLDPNPAHCEAYGGCPYHKDRGGPCDATFDPSQLAKGYEQMAELNEFQKRCIAMGMTPPGGIAAPAVMPAPEVASPPSTPEPPEPADPPKRGKGRPKGAKNKPKPPPAVVETTGEAVAEPEEAPAVEDDAPAAKKTHYSARLRIEVDWGESGIIEVKVPEDFEAYCQALIYGLTGVKSENLERV